MIRAALLAAVAMSSPALGAGCPLEGARYTQPGAEWTLQFRPVPRDAATNQMHAFMLKDEVSGTVLAGAIYAPNGFSQALGIVDRAACDAPADGEDAPACHLWEGPVYMNSEAGIGWIAERDTPAPRQILLAGFGSAWWYSELRETDNVPADVFSLKGCASQ